MLASPVRVDAGLKANVGAVVVGNNGLAVVAEELCAKQWLVFGIPFGIRLQMNSLETVRRIFRRSTRGNSGRTDAHRNRIGPKLETPNAKFERNSRNSK